ncbi:hypothetical protein ACFYUR_18870 [Micromonospora haikouensis]|uniref:hypothetical protein n=1 Tax=Micromonospora haikouensis TaxID=686309 RepID=UPI003687B4CE
MTFNIPEDVSKPSEAVIAGWWETYRAHTLREGRCPVCDVPHRCMVWANARADLVIHGLLGPDGGPIKADDPNV